MNMKQNLKKKSFEIIALQQLVSQDLRTVLTAFLRQCLRLLERMVTMRYLLRKLNARMKGEQEEESNMGRDVKARETTLELT